MDGHTAAGVLRGRSPAVGRRSAPGRRQDAGGLETVEALRSGLSHWQGVLSLPSMDTALRAPGLRASCASGYPQNRVFILVFRVFRGKCAQKIYFKSMTCKRCREPILPKPKLHLPKLKLSCQNPSYPAIKNHGIDAEARAILPALILAESLGVWQLWRPEKRKAARTMPSPNMRSRRTAPQASGGSQCPMH